MCLPNDLMLVSSKNKCDEVPNNSSNFDGTFELQFVKEDNSWSIKVKVSSPSVAVTLQLDQVRAGRDRDSELLDLVDLVLPHTSIVFMEEHPVSQCKNASAHP